MSLPSPKRISQKKPKRLAENAPLTKKWGIGLPVVAVIISLLSAAFSGVQLYIKIKEVREVSVNARASLLREYCFDLVKMAPLFASTLFLQNSPTPVLASETADKAIRTSDLYDQAADLYIINSLASPDQNREQVELDMSRPILDELLRSWHEAGWKLYEDDLLVRNQIINLAVSMQPYASGDLLASLRALISNSLRLQEMDRLGFSQLVSNPLESMGDEFEYAHAALVGDVFQNLASSFELCRGTI